MLIAASPVRTSQWVVMVIQLLTIGLVLVSLVRLFMVRRQWRQEEQRRQEEHRLFLEQAMRQQAVYYERDPLSTIPNEYTERLIGLFPDQADNIRTGIVRIKGRSKREWVLSFGPYWGV